MKYTHIIWDFNGTLFSDMEAGIKSVNTMLKERKLPTITTIEAYREIFKFPIIDYYKDLGFDFEKEPYEVLAPIWVELYNKNSQEASLQNGAKDALDFFKNSNTPQILLSATEITMLKSQTKELDISEYFTEILGLDNIHAYSKKALALEWKQRNPNAIPLFIGDTEHDASVAKAVDADCFLISNGHQSRKRLEFCECPVFNTLFDVMSTLKKFGSNT